MSALDVVGAGGPPRVVVIVVVVAAAAAAAAGGGAVVAAIAIFIRARSASRRDRMLTSANSMSDEKANTRHVEVQMSIALM